MELPRGKAEDAGMTRKLQVREGSGCRNAGAIPDRKKITFPEFPVSSCKPSLIGHYSLAACGTPVGS